MEEKKLVILVVSVMSIGCNFFPDKPIQKTIPGVIETGKSGIAWGGDSVFYSAAIKSVRTECIPIQMEDRKSGKMTNSKYRYNIAITAEIESFSFDSKRSDSLMRYPGLEATVRFEAITESSVSIMVNSVDVKFSSGVFSESVSCKLLGLSEEEVKRIKKIRASWVYS